MARLQVFLLGRLRVCRQGCEIAGLEAHKVQRLLAYLLLYHDHSHHREALAGLLWGDVPTTQAKTYLRKALWQLQSALALGETIQESDAFLDIQPEWIALRGDDVWADTLILEDIYAQIQGKSGYDLAEETVGLLDEAIKLYQGHLLEGWYDDWCLAERERLQHIYLTVLDKLMRYSEANGAYETGVDYGFRVLRCDMAREHTHRQLMRLHYRAGDRTGALRQYDQCAAALATELSVEPSRRTQELRDQICADRLPASFPPAPGHIETVDREKLGRLLDQITQLQRVLDDVQLEIQRQITVAG